MHKRFLAANVIRMLAILALALTCFACRTKQTITLRYLRLGWFAQPDELSTAAPLLEQFTRETGIALQNIPVPESTLDQLELSRKLLQDGLSGPDVLGIDVIWPGVLAPELIDLKPELGEEIAALNPALLPNYTVEGKVVAAPYGATAGVLEYRSDLLRQYGYGHPPDTWDQLETMAARIQAGERAKGQKDFWGFAWQGAPAEGLTCNALEWQVADGGGRIIEDDSTISVNNPKAIQAWQRARHWIGRISPPGVVAYRETDSMNVFDSGGAAFDRVWGGIPIVPTEQPRLLHLRSSLTLSRTGYTAVPGGPGGRAGTLGGSGLAVSRHSQHRKEAMQLARFLIRAEIQSERQQTAASLPALPPFFDLPGLSTAAQSIGERRSEVVARPSGVLGPKYEPVTRAYIEAVHAVLAGEKPPTKAAMELEKQLVELTQFRPGPPKKQN